jgi:hypothetical protein
MGSPVHRIICLIDKHAAGSPEAKNLNDLRTALRGSERTISDAASCQCRVSEAGTSRSTAVHGSIKHDGYRPGGWIFLNKLDFNPPRLDAWTKRSWTSVGTDAYIFAYSSSTGILQLIYSKMSGPPCGKIDLPRSPALPQLEVNANHLFCVSIHTLQHST